MINTFIQDVNMDNIKSIMSDIVSDYCTDHGIDENDIKPLVWNDIIDEIHEIIFKPNKTLLKYTPNTSNTYDPEKVLYVYGLYKRLCNSHEKVINIKGFCDMTGIDDETIYRWAAEPSHNACELHKKIMRDNEQSLESMLQDRSTNPMKILPSLNRWHHWNMPGVTRETVPKKALTVDQLPQLGVPDRESIVQIAQLESTEK